MNPEDMRGEIERLKSRVDGLEDELRVLRACVLVHTEMRRSIRAWWSFGDGQNHTHSWHTREDFISMWDREIDKVIRDAAIAREAK